MAGRELGVELIRVSGLVRYRSREKGSALLLDGLDLTVREGDSIGLVGPNGSGKSTLLRSLAGVETPVEGRVKRAPGVRVAYLPQALPTSASGTVWELASAGLADLKAAELRMRSEEAALASGEDRHEQYAAARAGFDRLGGYAAESGVREILAALGFPASVYKQSVERLSAGSRRRLALAAVLSAGADVILLDEPSNHLDMAARRWLEGHLARRTGAVVVVSHDRALLSTATTTTAFLDHGRLRLVDRGYDHAGGRAGANTPERRDKARAEEARRLEDVAAELARFSRRKRRSRHEPTKPGPAADSARQRKRLSGRLVSAEHVTITGTLDDATIRLDAGERIALLGPNGSGKSVLLRFLAGEVASQDPRTRLQYAAGLKLVWLSQESRGLVAEASLLEQASQALGAGLAKRTLAAAGVPHSAWQLAPEQLSGGERARAGLALALARPFDLLLLDEPENDLDLQAVEALETSLRERLEASGAALVLVTHDRRLALNLVARAWHLSAGSVYAHGSVRAYLRGDEPVPAERFWQEGAVSTNVAEEPTEAPEAPSTGQAPDATEALEAERSALLEDLLDPLAISERERTRTRERLTSVEEQLMAIYDERLEPAAPSRRFVERGVTVFADALAERRWAAVVADDSAAAREALRRPEAADRPWLELRTVEDVAHLKLHEQGDTCLLPWAKRALLDAGARLAFTVLGVGSVQYFDRGIAGTMLEPVGDGWWRLTLERFLAKEGWPVRPRQPRRRRRGDGERGGGAA